jgi:hypothetical protein
MSNASMKDSCSDWVVVGGMRPWEGAAEFSTGRVVLQCTSNPEYYLIPGSGWYVGKDAARRISKEDWEEYKVSGEALEFKKPVKVLKPGMVVWVLRNKEWVSTVKTELVSGDVLLYAEEGPNGAVALLLSGVWEHKFRTDLAEIAFIEALKCLKHDDIENLLSNVRMATLFSPAPGTVPEITALRAVAHELAGDPIEARRYIQFILRGYPKEGTLKQDLELWVQVYRIIAYA